MYWLLFTEYCTQNSLYCFLYSEFCKLYSDSEYCTLNSEHCIMYNTVNCTPNYVHWTVYTELSTLSAVLWLQILYTDYIYCTLIIYTVHWLHILIILIIYTVHWLHILYTDYIYCTLTKYTVHWLNILYRMKVKHRMSVSWKDWRKLVSWQYRNTGRLINIYKTRYR